MTPSAAARAVLRGWETNDPEMVASLFTPTGIFEDPLQPRIRTGPEDIRAACSGGMAAIRNCRIPVRLLIEQEHIAIVEAEFQSELATTGARFDFPFTMVVEMKDGLIQRLSEYFDTGPLRK